MMRKDKDMRFVSKRMKNDSARGDGIRLSGEILVVCFHLSEE